MERRVPLLAVPAYIWRSKHCQRSAASWQSASPGGSAPTSQHEAQGEDTFAMKRRRMPYVAKIKRDDPFRAADKREIEAMVKRIAAAGEHFTTAG